jgi:hypothetical protein
MRRTQHGEAEPWPNGSETAHAFRRLRRAAKRPNREAMQDQKDAQFEDRLMAWIDRRWRTAFWLMFAGACAYLLYYKWGQVHWLALSDTDDNMRFAEVRAWLAGKGWYDLRQHKIDPPNGISIHWSRIVDLPIAGLILLLQPFLGGELAARWACAIAPLLAMGAGLFGLMLTVRRLVHPQAYVLGARSSPARRPRCSCGCRCGSIIMAGNWPR